MPEFVQGTPNMRTQPEEKFPDGTTEADRICWVCQGDTTYRNCKIICKNCGFTRDCSDP